MSLVLITGGKGDIAQGIKHVIGGAYVLLMPGKDELDVRSYNSVFRFFDAHTKIEIVINNAGTIHPKTVKESVPRLWVQDIMVNLVGTYYVTKAALDRNPNTTIINIASTAAYAAYKDWSSYCASKSGVITLTKCLAADGVLAYAISPGATNTKFRNYFNLPNENMMPPERIGEVIIDILSGKYEPGVSIFMRNDQLEVR